MNICKEKLLDLKEESDLIILELSNCIPNEANKLLKPDAIPDDNLDNNPIITKEQMSCTQSRQ